MVLYSKDSLGVICNFKRTNDMWRRLLFRDRGYELHTSTLYDFRAINVDMITKTAMLIIEAFAMDDPVGYNVALSLIETNKLILIINNHTHASNLSEGSFWITYSFRGDLTAKIKTIIEGPCRTKEELYELVNIFPALKNKTQRRHR